MSKVVSKETAKSLPGMAFLREAKAELKKVTWPGKTQIWYSTLIVIAFTLSVSVYLGVLDVLLNALFTWLLGTSAPGS
jgi:preprotein translocase subunit SecE